jgi:hypothetical protein
MQIRDDASEAWEFKKSFFVKIKISPGWLKQNIFYKSKIPRNKS